MNYLSYWTDNGAYYYGDQWHESGGGGETLARIHWTSKAQYVKARVRVWVLGFRV